MDSSTHILVVFLSTALTLFLLLAIVAVAQIIRLVRTVQRIAQKAERIIETAEHVGEVFRNVSGPLGALQIVKNIIDIAQHKKRSHNE